MEINHSENTSDIAPDLLGEETDLLNQYVYASTGQRFLNWFIDNLLMRYTLTYPIGYGIGIILGLTNPEIINDLRDEDTFTIYCVAYVIVVLNYLCYYIICEKLFNGYTIGKLITGTRAIREDGDPLTIKDCFIRTICRFVPFEVFSGFKIRPWHDEWSRTMVIRSR